MSKQSKARKQQKARGSSLGVIVLGVVLVALAAGGFYYRHTLPVEKVEISGTYFSTPEEIGALVRVDTTARLYSLDPGVIADRAARHPWVARADAMRLPTGTLVIEIVERVPVALYIDAQGHPTHYLDAAGYAMPAPEIALFDVPLVHGAALPRHPTQPVATRGVRELMAALATLSADESALVSDLRVEPDGNVTLYTTEAPQGSTIPVLLGRSGFRASFTRLRAFWEQAILTRPDRTIETLDLRFSSQIVSRES